MPEVPIRSRAIPNRQPEHVIKNASQKEAFNSAIASLPMVTGQLVEYDEEGLPKIDEEQEVEEEEPVPKVVPEPKKVVPKVKALVKQETIAVHPVLNRMLNKFGLKRIKRFDLELSSPDGDKFKYTMTLVPEDCSLWAVREAKEKMSTDGTEVGSGWLSMLIVSLSVVAIDDTPIYEIFGVKPETKEEQNDLSNDRFNISARMRKQTGMMLANMFWSDVTPLADKLYEFYEGKIIPSSRVISSYELEASGSERYVCAFDNCDVVEFLKPKYDADGNELQYYCKVHKTELIKTLNLGVDENPLA